VLYIIIIFDTLWWKTHTALVSDIYLGTPDDTTSRVVCTMIKIKVKKVDGSLICEGIA